MKSLLTSVLRLMDLMPFIKLRLAWYRPSLYWSFWAVATHRGLGGREIFTVFSDVVERVIDNVTLALERRQSRVRDASHINA